MFFRLLITLICIGQLCGQEKNYEDFIVKRLEPQGELYLEFCKTYGLEPKYKLTGKRKEIQDSINARLKSHRISYIHKSTPQGATMVDYYRLLTRAEYLLHLRKLVYGGPGQFIATKFYVDEYVYNGEFGYRITPLTYLIVEDKNSCCGPVDRLTTDEDGFMFYKYNPFLMVDKTEFIEEYFDAKNKLDSEKQKK